MKYSVYLVPIFTIVFLIIGFSSFDSTTGAIAFGVAGAIIGFAISKIIFNDKEKKIGHD
ncbi:SoxR reducing system RseC family protein [Shouchella patagoniensis]|uniref:SoxR reducing system RseC family protein n=1 Tax=Shouchella patagoniensis TaxID=228576 RepID=UPI0011171887|nr:SoxR reducing system RseC family protein [Shouchella patagoniensis]